MSVVTKTISSTHNDSSSSSDSQHTSTISNALTTLGRQLLATLKFVGTRLPYNIFLLFLSTFLAYILAAQTFNPLANYIGRNPQPSAQTLHTISENLNLNGNIFSRYFHWLSGVILHGDFGKTITQTNINDELWSRLGVSLRLVLPGTILGVCVGLLIGYHSAIRQYKIFDHAASILTFVLISTPILVSAPLLKWLAVYVNSLCHTTIFLYAGETSPTNNHAWFNFVDLKNVQDRLQHIIIPTTVLMLILFGSYSRYMRGSMLDELGQDYIRTARAKGLTRKKAISRHGFRTALIPLATLFAFSLGTVITGATFTERLFAWHGIGEWVINGISTQDINITLACVFFSALGVVISRILADIFLSLLDPRVRNKK